ncbi:MAG: sulfite exporter TauE/SafE family protein [Treponemataceae bacterium]|nr:MAG: sulfite exporter TauE/SafE family protein [Treponemataceae bacterium]
MLKTENVRIGGMTCENCKSRIEKKLQKTDGVQRIEVDFARNTASVTFDDSVTSVRVISAIIEDLGYSVTDSSVSAPMSAVAARAKTAVSYAVIIFALWMIFQHLGTGIFSQNLVLAESGMPLTMLFVIGLITSLHCIAMCGGINLSQCIGTGEPCKPEKNVSGKLASPILYNAGRVISYTLVGALVGALGGALSVTPEMQGGIQIAAGVFMLVMGLNMLGLFPSLRRFMPRLPKVITQKIDSSRMRSSSPLIVGLLNGLMPCGPLQAMQLYALGTGSPATGALSMFIFSLGTVPLMFAIGAAGSLLSKKPQLTNKIVRGGAVLVAVLGLVMFTNGYSLAGLPSLSDGLAGLMAPPSNNKVAQAQEQNAQAQAVSAPVAGVQISNGVQLVSSTLKGGRYPAITVQQGIPVKWTITAPPGSLNGCNNRMIIREYGIQYSFKQGDNVIEFMPKDTGRFNYSCWMGMIRSTITVVAQGETGATGTSGESVPQAPKSAGVKINTATLAIGAINSSAGIPIQTVTLNFTDAGFSPAVAVMQKNVRTRWVINCDVSGNETLVFPAYAQLLPVENGENVITLEPTEDFDFSTDTNTSFGFVKVVDDIKKIDESAIKKEAGARETMIYPADYFESAYDTTGSASCCGGAGGNV